jgi:dimethylaniline monooxygenase (N-oxide forming)
MPTIPGLDKFAGTSVHVQYFKRPQDFAGKRVIVVGFGNSAADTATSLVGHASKTYLSHRHGARILPRMYNGAPIDHTHSLRLFTIQCLILKYFPQWGERTFDKFLKGMQDKSFTLRDEWGFEPAQKIPMVSDTLVESLEAGTIESVSGIERVLNTSTVELSNNRTLEIDAIIWCTGYTSDFSIIDPRFSPSTPRDSTPKWSEAKGSNNKPVFKLYYNVFSPTAPSSLAFLGNVHFAIGGFLVFDLASMAVAQVWSGASSLPSESQMNNEIEKQHEWLADLASRGFNVSPGTVDAGPWMRAMNELAGTGVGEYLGYGWEGWWFWIRNRKFCDLLMGGLWSPCIYRVFKGKRDRWEGARGAVERINALKCSKKED